MNLHLPAEFQLYKPNVIFNIDSKNFIVKTAEVENELLGAFRLRNSVFYEEWTGKSTESGLDIDEYDMQADHLIVIKKDTNEVIATYRLIATQFKSNFYTEKFFNIKSFLKNKPGNKVEMGRACVDKKLRDMQSIHHIWLGLLKYFRHTFSRYMFGCVSIIDTVPEYVACLYNTFLEKEIIDKEAVTPPLNKYQINSFNDLLLKVKADSNSLLKLPKLFSWYLSLGAKIHGLPIYDPEFGAHDFFITLDFKNIGREKLVNRYPDAVYLKNALS